MIDGKFLLLESTVANLKEIVMTETNKMAK